MVGTIPSSGDCLDNILWFARDYMMNDTPKFTAAATYPTAASASGYPHILHSEGSEGSGGEGGQPRKPGVQAGEQEANGRGGLEDAWHHSRNPPRAHRTRNGPGDKDPNIRSSIIKRERTLITLGIIAALVWGALFGQLLS